MLKIIIKTAREGEMYSSNNDWNNAYQWLHKADILTPDNRELLKKYPQYAAAFAALIFALYNADLLTQNNFVTIIIHRDYLNEIQQGLAQLVTLRLANQATFEFLLKQPAHANSRTDKLVRKIMLARNEVFQTLTANKLMTPAVYEFIYDDKTKQAIIEFNTQVNLLAAANSLDENILWQLINNIAQAPALAKNWLKVIKVQREIYDLLRFIFLFNQTFWGNRLKFSGGVEVTILGEDYYVPRRAAIIINILLSQQREAYPTLNLTELFNQELPAESESMLPHFLYSALTSLPRSPKTKVVMTMYADVAKLKADKLGNLAELKKAIQAIKSVMVKYNPEYRFIENYEEYCQAGNLVMVTEIIANYLTISTAQSTALIQLLSYEAHWTMQLSHLRSKVDVINFLQKIAQEHWYHGQDRSQLTKKDLTRSEWLQYYELFKSFGLTEAVAYPVNIAAPAISVVLGSSVAQVEKRVARLQQDLAANLLPATNDIIGLSCNRELGTYALHEDAILQRLIQTRHKPTEMNMVNLLVREMLSGIDVNLAYVPIAVYAPMNNTNKAGYTNTATTALALKKYCENAYPASSAKHPLIIAMYSSQPYVWRQQLDMQLALGSEYQVVGISRGMNFNEFRSDKRNIDLFLGEVARLIYINYTPANLKPFSAALNEKPLAQLVLELSRLHDLPTPPANVIGKAEVAPPPRLSIYTTRQPLIADETDSPNQEQSPRNNLP